MSKSKTLPSAARTPQKATRAPAPTPPAPAPLFRKIDWFTLAATFVLTWLVYFLTLAPEVTLEDSGELVTGAFYAGIPHPPGYPVWTIYSWLWTVLLPMGSIAWRVALAQATAGALACALIALMVSRGSSLLIASIESIKTITGPWEKAISIVSGLVAGLLMGFDGFMWRESVAANRMAVSSVPWFMLMLLCLLRWLYAPHQLRFLYWALFIFGICFTAHQSLIVAAMGIEVLIATRNPRLGRDAFLANAAIYLLYNLAVQFNGHHLFHNLGAKPGLLLIFHGIGLGSLIAGLWLAIRTKGLFSEWKPVLFMGLLWALGASFYLYLPIAGMTNPPMQWCYPRTVDGFFHALTRGQYEQPNPTNLLVEPGRFLGQLAMLVGGLGESFTWLCVLLALVPFAFFLRMQKRERAWLVGLLAIYLCLGVLLMILLNPTPDRSSAELIKVFFNSSHTLIAALIGYGLALTAAYMAAHYQRFRRWGLLGGTIAVTLALYSLLDSVGTHYFGPAGQVSLSDLPHWIGRAFAKNQYGLPIYASLLLVASSLSFVFALLIYRRRAPLAIFLALLTALPIYGGLSHWFECDQRGHVFGYWFGHDMFTPPFKDLALSPQGPPLPLHHPGRGGLGGRGPDHVAGGKPIYAEMTKDAVLFGGTDPGRFCPTYMVFCESFTPHHCQPAEDQRFDRRDVYVITQNALADPPYLNYIRAHYFRSNQVDPPFFSELARTIFKDNDYQTNLLAKVVRPVDSALTSLGERVEKRRRTYTSWFKAEDFIDLPAFAAKLRPDPQQDPLSKYLYENLSAPTQKLVCAVSLSLSDRPRDIATIHDLPLLRRHLARDLNQLLERELVIGERITALHRQKDPLDQTIIEGRGSARLLNKSNELEQELAHLSSIGPLYQPERFQHVVLSEYLTDFLRQNPRSHSRIRLNRLLLEAAYPQEIAKSLGGVYPDQEIYTPSITDQQSCYQEYIQDAARRKQLNQLKPGEDVTIIDNRVQVSGQVSVMAINALLTKVIFDHNPKHEFFVEESMPLDWMYPHLAPYGIIMKINRQPLPSLSDEILQKDHLFWKQYSHRLTGDIIDYDTSVKQVIDWIQKTYLHYDFNGFTGDRKFVHDRDAQKSFSKLRTAIAGLYAWRLGPQCPPEYRPKSNAEFQSLFREANFAFLQAFAFCPYNPETLFRYLNLLLQFNHLDDALLLTETYLKLDPYSVQAQALLDNLQNFKKQQRSLEQTRSHL